MKKITIINSSTHKISRLCCVCLVPFASHLKLLTARSCSASVRLAWCLLCRFSATMQHFVHFTFLIHTWWCKTNKRQQSNYSIFPFIKFMFFTQNINDVKIHKRSENFGLLSFCFINALIQWSQMQRHIA